MWGGQLKNHHLPSTIITKVLCLCFFAIISAQCHAIEVIYPQPESLTDVRFRYFVSLLQLALSKTNEPFTLMPYAQRMSQARALTQLETNAGIDVVWTMTSREREEALLPIRIPIDKGLFGWRLFLINKNDHGLFQSVHNVEDLIVYTAGQGHDWPDTQILRYNKLKVVTGSTYESLFNMLKAGRFQYLPRSLAEVWNEAESHADFNLEVEQNIGLHYTTCLYFFVNKQNKQLYELLDRGLRIAISDGSFDKLFLAYYGDFISRSKLNTRTIIELDNPLLPDKTPINDAKLWFHR